DVAAGPAVVADEAAHLRIVASGGDDHQRGRGLPRDQGDVVADGEDEIDPLRRQLLQEAWKATCIALRVAPLDPQGPGLGVSELPESGQVGAREYTVGGNPELDDADASLPC